MDIQARCLNEPFVVKAAMEGVPDTEATPRLQFKSGRFGQSLRFISGQCHDLFPGRCWIVSPLPGDDPELLRGRHRQA
jgi:hypothetical protein